MWHIKKRYFPDKDIEYLFEKLIKKQIKKHFIERGCGMKNKERRKALLVLAILNWANVVILSIFLIIKFFYSQ